MLSCGLFCGSLAYSTMTYTQVTDLEKISYAIGYDLNNSLPQEVVWKEVVQGLQDAYQGKVIRYSSEEIEQAYMNYSAKIEQQHRQEAQKNRAQGYAFLVENATKQGVYTIASGLQYKILKQGQGKKPTQKSTVTVHYEGRLINGKVFDSSYTHQEPASFPLDMVIKGWQEGLTYIAEGGVIELYIPADLAYGDLGTRDIPRGSTLLFKVELLKVK